MIAMPGLKTISFLILALLTFACSLEPHVIEHKSERVPVRDQSIFISSHGWHTGIIVPAEVANTGIPLLKQRFTETAYYEFGWGDAGFYRAEKISFGLIVQAIFWPTDAVMHVVAIPIDPASYFIGSEIVEVRLSKNELQSVLAFIKNSFEMSDSNQLLDLETGIYGDSQFYRATGNYFITNTCNKWTAKGLKSTGMDISLWFKFTATSIMDYIKQSPRHIDALVEQ